MWKVGNEWTYRYETPSGTGTFVWRLDRIEALANEPHYVITAGTREIFNPSTWRPVAFPLSVGLSWDMKYLETRPAEHQTENVERRCVAEADEARTVPAGTFATIRIVCNNTRTNAWVNTVWYSPEVNHMVRGEYVVRSATASSAWERTPWHAVQDATSAYVPLPPSPLLNHVQRVTRTSASARGPGRGVRCDAARFLAGRVPWGRSGPGEDAHAGMPSVPTNHLALCTPSRDAAPGSRARLPARTLLGFPTRDCGAGPGPRDRGEAVKRSGGPFRPVDRNPVGDYASQAAPVSGRSMQLVRRLVSEAMMASASLDWTRSYTAVLERVVAFG